MDDFRTPRCERPPGLVRPVRLDPAGELGPTRSAARHGRWRRCAPGWYVPSDVDRVPEQRILEQSVRTGELGAVTGWGSLRWQGAAYLDGHAGEEELPVALVLGHLGNLSEHPGSVVSRERLNPREVVIVDGVRCTVPARAVFDEVRRSPGWRAAVVVADMAVAAGLISPDELCADVAVRTGWTAISRARTTCERIRGGHESPQEVLLGLAWEGDAGLPRPLYNVPVFDRHGQLLGVPDLFDPDAGLVAEYDGANHLRLDRRRSDARREAAFREHGLEYVTVVRGELDDLDLVVSRLLATRRRARFLAPDERAWTLDLPAWWGRFAATTGRLVG